MRITLRTEARLVKMGIMDLIQPPHIDFDYIETVIANICATQPVVPDALTLEEADVLAKEISDWHKQLGTMKIEPKPKLYKEALMVASSRLIQQLNRMHGAFEERLFELGVIESGKAES